MDRQDLLNVELGVDRLDIASCNSCRTDKSELDLSAHAASTFARKTSALSSLKQPESSNSSSRTSINGIIITSTSSTSRRRKLKRTVSFATKATANIIASLDDMSELEKKALWRTAEDRKDDELNIVQTVKAYRNADAKSGSCKKQELLAQDMTPRGIEHLINPENRDRHRQRRDRMVDAVLDLQDDYWKRGLIWPSPSPFGRSA